MTRFGSFIAAVAIVLSVPGCGPVQAEGLLAGKALESGWAIERSGMLNGFSSQRMINGGGASAPCPQRPLGNFCLTGLGRAGPSPFEPVGAFCTDVWGNSGHGMQ